MSWENITWIFLHSYAEKIKINFFEKHKNNCLGLIKYTCCNLPCKICSKHATDYFNKYNVLKCKTKEDLKKFLWIFHNNVNKRLKKPLFKYEGLDKYKRANFLNILKKFLYEYEKKYVYTRTMDSWLRKNYTKRVKLFLIINKHQFN